MFRHSGNLIDLGELLEDLCIDQAEWSQKTFGKDCERSGIGALAHLAKEAIEAQEELWKCIPGSEKSSVIASPELKEELADCLLLILDASRRSGVGPRELLQAAKAKMEINKSREWPTPVDDQPVEHIRNGGE